VVSWSLVSGWVGYRRRYLWIAVISLRSLWLLVHIVLWVAAVGCCWPSDGWGVSGGCLGV
jgi:hypothetical protein